MSGIFRRPYRSRLLELRRKRVVFTAAGAVSESVSDVGEVSDSVVATVAVSKAASDIGKGSEVLVGVAATYEIAADSGDAYDGVADTIGLSESVSDIGEGTDTQVNTVAAQEAASDIGEGSDSEANTAAMFESVSDEGEATDTVLLDIGLAVSDEGEGTDTVFDQQGVGESVSDSGDATDTVAFQADTPVSVSDIGEATDTAVSKASVFEVTSDSGEGTDSVVSTIGIQESASDSGDGSDSVDLDVGMAVSDIGEGTDSVSTTVGFQESVSDIGETTDSESDTAATYESVSDEGEATDSVVDEVSGAAYESVSDIGEASDSVAKKIDAYEIVSDIGETTDSVAFQADTPQSLSDSGEATDSVIEVSGAVESVSDIGEASDSVIEIAGFKESVSDSGDTSDSVVEVLGAQEVASDVGEASEVVVDEVPSAAEESVSDVGKASDTVVEIPNLQELSDGGEASEALVQNVNQYRFGRDHGWVSENVLIEVNSEAEEEKADRGLASDVVEVFVGAAPTDWITDFSEYSVGQRPSDWVPAWAATNDDWVVRQFQESYGNTALFGSRETTQHAALLWNAPGSLASPHAACLFKFSHTSVSKGTGIALRISGATGSENGYVVRLTQSGADSRLEIVRFTDGTETQLTWAYITAASARAAIPRWIRAEAVGTTIRAKIWNLGATEPGSWTVSTTDSDHSTGKVGIYGYETAPEYTHYFSVNNSTDADLPDGPASVAEAPNRVREGNLAHEPFTYSDGPISLPWVNDPQHEQGYINIESNTAHHDAGFTGRAFLDIEESDSILVQMDMARNSANMVMEISFNEGGNYKADGYLWAMAWPSNTSYFYKWVGGSPVQIGSYFGTGFGWPNGDLLTGYFLAQPGSLWRHANHVAIDSTYKDFLFNRVWLTLRDDSAGAGKYVTVDDLILMRSGRVVVKGLPDGWTCHVGVRSGTSRNALCYVDVFGIELPNSNLIIKDGGAVTQFTITPDGGVYGGDVYSFEVGPDKPEIYYDDLRSTQVRLFTDAFSDPLGFGQGATHWQVDLQSGDYSSPVIDFESSETVFFEQYTATGLSGNVAYKARVSKRSTDGRWSEWSDSVLFTTPVEIKPDKPTLYYDSVTFSSFRLFTSTYSHPNNEAHVSTHWQVDVQGGDFSSPALLDIEDLTYLVERGVYNALPSTSYDARVRVRDALGIFSLWSDTITITTTAVPPSRPDKPVGTLIEVTTNYAHVSCTYSHGGAEPHWQTQWQLSDNPNFWFLLEDFTDSVPALNHYFSGLASNKAYWWRVRVRDSSGDWSDWSFIYYFRTASVYIPGPQGGVIEITSPRPGEGIYGTWPITWTPANPPDATFEIEYTPNDGTTWIPLVDYHYGSPYYWDVSGLENRSGYAIRVRAHTSWYDTPWTYKFFVIDNEQDLVSHISDVDRVESGDLSLDGWTKYWYTQETIAPNWRAGEWGDEYGGIVAFSPNYYPAGQSGILAYDPFADCVELEIANEFTIGGGEGGFQWAMYRDCEFHYGGHGGWITGVDGVNHKGFSSALYIPYVWPWGEEDEKGTGWMFLTIENALTGQLPDPGVLSQAIGKGYVFVREYNRRTRYALRTKLTLISTNPDGTKNIRIQVMMTGRGVSGFGWFYDEVWTNVNVNCGFMGHMCKMMIYPTGYRSGWVEFLGLWVMQVSKDICQPWEFYEDLYDGAVAKDRQKDQGYMCLIPEEGWTGCPVIPETEWNVPDAPAVISAECETVTEMSWYVKGEFCIDLVIIPRGGAYEEVLSDGASVGSKFLGDAVIESDLADSAKAWDKSWVEFSEELEDRAFPFQNVGVEMESAEAFYVVVSDGAKAGDTEASKAIAVDELLDLAEGVESVIAETPLSDVAFDGEDWLDIAVGNDIKAKKFFYPQGDSQNFDAPVDAGDISLKTDAPYFSKCIRMRQNPEGQGSARTIYSWRHFGAFEGDVKYPVLWLRWFIRFEPGWTNDHTGLPGEPARSYKMSFIKFEGGPQSRLCQYDYDARHCPNLWGYPPSAYDSNSGSDWHIGYESGEWDDGEWYELVQYVDARTNPCLGGWWIRRYTLSGAKNPGPWSYLVCRYDRYESLRTVGIGLGQNFNKALDNEQYLNYGPWEVVNGEDHPDPYGLMSYFPW